MEPFEIKFEHNNQLYTGQVEKRESPRPQYIVYFTDAALDLKYGHLIYELESGHLSNRDDKTLEDADLIARIGLAIKDGLEG